MQNIVTGNRPILFMAGFYALGLALMLLSTTLYAGGKNMETLYDLTNTARITPQEFKMRKDITHLFPVPRDNAIATNDFGNTITLLRFEKGRLRSDEIPNESMDDLSGGDILFLPVFDPNVIGYTQTRGFLLYNLKTREYKDYRICYGLESTITKVAVANAQTRQFLFEIERFSKKSNGSDDDYTNYIHLMDLSGKEPKLIKEVNIGIGVAWFLASGKIFFYDIGKKQLRVQTINLEPSHHPLVDAIKRNKDKISYTRLILHPYLPFAILFAGKIHEVIISWDPARDDKPYSLFGENSGAYQFSFSPDGKWLVFRDDFTDPERTYLMPVSEKYPHFLGTPILLIKDYFEEYSCAWTTNTISFVGSSLDKLYRWELTKEAHPECDKADFHEWVVERDLEKLRKEKKQGLGQEKK